MTSKLAVVALLLLTPASSAAQYYQTDFPAEEFKARHARVFEEIGENAVAVVQSPEVRVLHRQWFGWYAPVRYPRDRRPRSSC